MDNAIVYSERKLCYKDKEPDIWSCKAFVCHFIEAAQAAKNDQNLKQIK